MNRSELSRMAGAIDGSTININVVIIIIIIITGLSWLKELAVNVSRPSVQKYVTLHESSCLQQK